MDDGKRRQLDRLLGRFESQRRTALDEARAAEITRQRHRHRFEDLQRDTILPAFRDLAAKLERKGHLTRLREDGVGKVRLDVQLQSPVPKRGAFQLKLVDGDAAVEVTYRSGWDELHRQTHPVSEVDGAFVLHHLLVFFEALVGKV